ncbi:hypothetical protein Q5424_22770 [Conexibacter sp. JD483]|uniref:hypothetical protein n=1 Tax=unclassified Conexibacter TaxID=2627773 RepID=UPI0027268ABE|nr:MULTISPECIES: hypothetical protein [unclassified Conexibacter]MDO8189197.1 hypothetical protein [Conexibacter sp. CPCC 205706]MDO8201930.1 hypothetical protein [Conexibacter sp. CPCC 205762]MDR9371939.1 hypothetical protein [Conexibacter sp. JD483]
MSNAGGWTALAGAVVALAGGATTAQGAAAAASARQPALAAGVASDGTRFRLEGRMLTVRAPRPLTPRRWSRPRVPIWFRCGEGALVEVGVAHWLGVASRTIRVPRGARVVRARLDRDVARRANRCEWSAGDFWGEYREGRARLSLRRGRPVGCEPAPREDVVVRSSELLLTGFGDEDWYGYRSCVRPDGPFRDFGFSEDSGGGGGSADFISRFAVHGTWVAWVRRFVPHSTEYSSGRAWLYARDLAAGDGRPGPLQELEAPPADGVDELTFSDDGSAVVWRAGDIVRTVLLPAEQRAAFRRFSA